jgi:hypothetical protein
MLIDDEQAPSSTDNNIVELRLMNRTGFSGGTAFWSNVWPLFYTSGMANC